MNEDSTAASSTPGAICIWVGNFAPLPVSRIGKPSGGVATSLAKKLDCCQNGQITGAIATQHDSALLQSAAKHLVNPGNLMWAGPLWSRRFNFWSWDIQWQLAEAIGWDELFRSGREAELDDLKSLCPVTLKEVQQSDWTWPPPLLD